MKMLLIRLKTGWLIKVWLNGRSVNLSPDEMHGASNLADATNKCHALAVEHKVGKKR